MRTATLAMLLALAVTAINGPLTAQASQYTAGPVPKWLPGESITRLRDALGRGEWASALRQYFGSSYTPDLTDIVIYINSRGEVTQELMRKGKPVTDRVLHGQKYVYVVLFTEAPLPSEKQKPKSDSAGTSTRDSARMTMVFRSAGGDSLRFTVEATEESKRSTQQPGSLIVHRTSLDYQTDPLLARLVNAVVSKLFSAASPNGAPGIFGDSASKTRLDSLGSDDAGPLYVAFRRMRVAENTWSRITVEADTNWVLPGSQVRSRAVVTNFANTDGSPLAVALGVLATLHARTIAGDSVVGQSTATGIYLLGQWHLFRRGELPARRFSSGPVVGISPSSSDLIHSFFVGVSADRVLGELGAVAGGSLIQSKDKSGRRDTWILRWSWGLELPL